MGNHRTLSAELTERLILAGFIPCPTIIAFLSRLDARGSEWITKHAKQVARSLRANLARQAGKVPDDLRDAWLLRQVRLADRLSRAEPSTAIWQTAIIRHSKLYATLHAAADAAGLTDRAELDRRIAICYRCPHTDGLGCAEFGCSNNSSILSRWRSIVLDPQQHCPIYGAETW